MPARKHARRTTPTPEHSGLEHFHKFFADADRVALELLIREGVLTDPRTDHDFYNTSLEALAKQFCQPFTAIELDEPDAEPLVSFDELQAKQRAAHMIGFAMGLRLGQADLNLEDAL